MEPSEPTCVNPNDIQYKVNSLRLEDLQISLDLTVDFITKNCYFCSKEADNLFLDV